MNVPGSPSVLRAMSSTAALLIAALVCATPPSDEDAVRKTFADYKAALYHHKGKAASALVDSNTLKYFDRLKRLAVDADSATLHREPMMNRLFVARMRHEIDP